MTKSGRLKVRRMASSRGSAEKVLPEMRSLALLALTCAMMATAEAATKKPK